jgi:hypothetical protein
VAAVTAREAALEDQPQTRAVHGMVASRSFEAEADAVRSGVLAARLVSAGLRAAAGDFDEHDAAALHELVDALAAEARSAQAATTDYVRYAFAHATHEAAPAGELDARPFADDLDRVLSDARLVLEAGLRRDADALADAAVAAAAERIADRYRAVSERVMARAGGPGDTLGGWDA